MLNREKYANELIDIAIDGGGISVVDDKPRNCYMGVTKDEDTPIFRAWKRSRLTCP